VEELEGVCRPVPRRLGECQPHVLPCQAAVAKLPDVINTRQPAHHLP
jgi:hypothetical protein